MNTKQLLVSSAIAALLAIPGMAQAQTAQTFNLQVPSSGPSSYTDSSGNIYTLNIPSTINIGTLQFSPANSGPSIVSSSTLSSCTTLGVNTCSGGGIALTSGDKLVVLADGDQGFAATPITLSGGTGAIGTCSLMTGTGYSNGTDSHTAFFICPVTTSGTPTNIVVHYAANFNEWGGDVIKSWDIHNGSDHGNGATASGTGTNPSVTTVAGSNGQPSANALVLAIVGGGGTTITPTPGWTVVYNNGYSTLEYEKTSGSGPVTASATFSTSEEWSMDIAVLQ